MALNKMAKMPKKTNSFRAITFFCNKGGNGKTASAIMYATILAQKGYKVLLLDNDGQANASDFTGAPIIPQQGTIRIEDLYKDININTPKAEERINITLLKEAIQESEIGYAYIESSKILDTILPKINNPDINFTVWRIMQAIKSTFDFCIIDSPCKADILSANSIIAADDVIISIATEGDTGKTLVNNIFLFESLKNDYRAQANIDRVLPVKIKTQAHITDIIPMIEQFASTNYNSKIAGQYIKYSSDMENCMVARGKRIECIRSGRGSDAFISYIESVEEYLKDHGIEDNSEFTVIEVKDLYGKKRKKIVFDKRDIIREYQLSVRNFLKAENIDCKIYTESNNIEINPILPRYKIIVNMTKNKGLTMDNKACFDKIHAYLESTDIPFILKTKEFAEL